MFHLKKLLLPLVGVALISACDQFPMPPAPGNSTRSEPIVQNVEEIEAGVRLAEADKRIADLERKVSELEATPQTLALDVLKQRVAALEADVADKESLAQARSLVPEQLKKRLSTDTSPVLPGRILGRSPTPTSKLNLPDLERKPRPATNAEEKAFARIKED
jgi:TolA-binding protein